MRFSSWGVTAYVAKAMAVNRKKVAHYKFFMIFKQNKRKKSLPFSSTLLLSRDEPVDRQVLHTLESVVIDWSHQIRDVLKRDSSEPLLQGLNPLPTTELNFWEARYDNLKCIYDQVAAILIIACHKKILQTSAPLSEPKLGKAECCSWLLKWTLLIWFEKCTLKRRVWEHFGLLLSFLV